MTYLQALLLGLVQGLTEFLPVSSSGHLVLGKKVLHVPTEMPVTFEVVVHLGTLVATLLVFWQPVWEILAFLGQRTKGIFSASADSANNASESGRSPLHTWWNDPAGRMLILVILGTIPAGMVGVLLQDQLEVLFSNALLVGGALCTTGTLLFFTRFATQSRDGRENISLLKGLLVGVAQAIAITPGISRSGSTISTALFCGVDRETAARFSFVLSMPAIAGAAILKARDITETGIQIGWTPLVVGFMSSLIMGYIALRVLLVFVRRGRFHWFAYYCWFVGLAAILAHLT